jgi:excisionase family DNA binding protein
MSDQTTAYNFLSPSTAARMLDVHRNTILRMVKNGELKHILLHGRYRISEADLIALIQNAQNGAKVPA